ncbi:hypothetical protein B0J13DRAFT_328042 [Dactylonectria estremocensis]|uniref:Zn(2)-C6 fungal-type domain-containing protein n=1 Tax=Dactylonectria estremocensis TaxID=1079267 RepID=A0A9P9EVJ8_9HYPO|nr:hypothetical protein B0J13DRAFT_328042 [Dactylonectria estremocensis]
MVSPLPLGERKACLGCAKAKRTCDKRMPSCQRCCAKKLNCQYSTVRRYWRAPSASARPDIVSPTNALMPHVEHPQLQADTRQVSLYNTMGDICLTDLATANSPTATPVTYTLWFLELETWAISDVGTTTCRFNPEPIPASIGAKSWTFSVAGWLRQWVQEGCNPFIHKQLYLDTGLPQCLQDAWLTATAYSARTAQNEHIVMNILDDRANSLLQAQIHDDDSFMAVPGLQTIQHLARVQALFVYQYLRLYDGSIRQRAVAENTIPILQTWCQQLWQSAALDAHHSTPLQSTAELGGLDPRDGLTTLPHWKAWILSESVRRTWLVCQSTLATYFRERDGWNECTGEIKFTACQGLWDATSSGAWAELVSGREPLFVRSLHVDELISTAMPTEVDSFSTVFMTLLMGREKVDSWAASQRLIKGSSIKLGAESPSE